MAGTEELLFHFRGGPVDGRFLPVPISGNGEWSIPTVDGIWLGDRSEPLPPDLASIDYRNERYLLVGDDFVHETLVTDEDEPPEHWAQGG